jgi:hypothetical protein
MPEGLEHEEFLGPDDPGSMAFKLSRADEEREAARQAGEAAEAAEAQAAAEAAEAQAAAEAEAQAQAQKDADLEPPKPKYASIEEAERAANEAAARMHTATEEAARERKAREALETEMAEVRLAQETAAAEVAKLVPKTERKEAFAGALKKIQAIPLSRGEDGEVIYPDDYDDQVAEAWASTSVDPHEVAKEAAKLAREELRRERAAEDTRTADEKAEAQRKAIIVDAEKMAVEHGLDMTPGSADYRLFYSHVDELAGNPEHEFAEKPFAEQVKWATQGVRQVLGKKIELTEAERIAARRAQDRNAILERGVNRVALPEPNKQRTMQEILAAQK